MRRYKSKAIREFGDFQTPAGLAQSVCHVLKKRDISPRCILEPTCGRGSFLEAAAHAYPATPLLGVDRNPRHLAVAHDRLSREIESGRVALQEGDFFSFEWESVLAGCPGPWLVLGNPPWVTSAELGSLDSTNVPDKSNVAGRSGIEALTGKSNFDISEWMLQRYLTWLKERDGWVAVLVKSVVARKILAKAWKDSFPVSAAAIYKIDAMEHFGAAVDACLFVLAVHRGAVSSECSVFDDLRGATPARIIGFHDGFLIADVDAYMRWRHLLGKDLHFVWRSGIKHDCSNVMELSIENGHYRNGLGEVVAIEDRFLYPLLKSSDVNKKGDGRARFLIVTQRHPREDTAQLRVVAPRTWEYLQSHAARLDKRGSSIYRNRPPFSIFGVGEYSFAPWKVAISGFYKSLRFIVVGPINGRPVVFDDTVYFLACRSREEAELLANLLNTSVAHQFYESMIFWSDKRPITGDLLSRLSLVKLAHELGRTAELEPLAGPNGGHDERPSQLSLL